MNQLNIQPTVKEQTSRNKTFWRVIVGPAVDMNERSTLLQKVKAVGFGDAYSTFGMVQKFAPSAEQIDGKFSTNFN